jgi:hypothetical protein
MNYLFVVLIWASIVISAIVGEVLCIIKFVKCDFSNETSYKAEVIYGVSAITGFGSIVGYFNIPDE